MIIIKAVQKQNGAIFIKFLLLLEKTASPLLPLPSISKTPPEHPPRPLKKKKITVLSSKSTVTRQNR